MKTNNEQYIMKKTLLIILVAVTGAIAFNANAQVLQSTSESSSSSKSVEKEHVKKTISTTDFYGGVQLGKTIINDEYVSSLGGMLNSISYYYFGGQYFFNDNFAVNARFAGWGIINLGVTYKF